MLWGGEDVCVGERYVVWFDEGGEDELGRYNVVGFEGGVLRCER